MIQQSRFAWIWPDVETPDGEKKAAMHGFWACVLIVLFSVFWGLLAYYTPVNPEHLEADYIYILFIYVPLMFFIAWRISTMSRIFAIVGFIIYCADRISSALIKPEDFRISYLSLIIVFMFINSIRGTFAYHRRIKSEKAVDNSI